MIEQNLGGDPTGFLQLEFPSKLSEKMQKFGQKPTAAWGRLSGKRYLTVLVSRAATGVAEKGDGGIQVSIEQHASIAAKVNGVRVRVRNSEICDVIALLNLSHYEVEFSADRETVHLYSPWKEL
jgi:hypothetical protein